MAVVADLLGVVPVLIHQTDVPVLPSPLRLHRPTVVGARPRRALTRRRNPTSGP